MKVLINVKYGGFGLSDAVYEKLGPEYKDHDFYTDRANPRLIEVVEELGLEASADEISKLRIVEIPDDVEWEINGHAGSEWITEKHRTWS